MRQRDDLNPHLDSTVRTLAFLQRALPIGDPRGMVTHPDRTRADDGNGFVERYRIRTPITCAPRAMPAL